MSDAMPSEAFDYIVVGAGSAGCVLANRLSADPDKRVLLLEAGGRDNWIWFHIPVGYLFAIGNPRSDWMFKTEPEAGLNGRALNYPRGKAIGGSSAINAMIYMRGQAADYDHWRQLGLQGWGWNDVLPIFKAHEDHFLGKSEYHSTGGEWRIEFPRVKYDIIEAIRAAAEEAGIAKIEDFNRGDNEGSCGCKPRCSPSASCSRASARRASPTGRTASKKSPRRAAKSCSRRARSARRNC